ncbi:hypothetical protein Esti_005741 [Eimeria stiedai]
MGWTRRVFVPLLILALGRGAHASASDTSTVENASIVDRGEAFWLCRSGAAGVACDVRREPAFNASGVQCGEGLCCTSENDEEPFTCKQQPCADAEAIVGGKCSCANLGSTCDSVQGASGCVDVPVTGRLGGAACVCEPPLIADNFRQKCATCVCAENYVFNPKSRRCVPAPLDRCKTERACGPEEAVYACRENPMTGRFICTCNEGYLLNARNNMCERKCNELEEALCGEASSHDADRCSVGISGRLCACAVGFVFDPLTHKCIEEQCYTPECGWYEGVSSCKVVKRRPVCRCASGFQRYTSGECLPECKLGWRYNRNREMCEISDTTCPLEDCGPENAVEQCVVEKDSGMQICKCKKGFAISTATGQCELVPTCPSDACQVFGLDAICVSDGSSSYACQCVSDFATVGTEKTSVLTLCSPVECLDNSVCGDPAGVKECVQTATGVSCSCAAAYKLDPITRRCVPDETLDKPLTVVSQGSLRVAATRAPLRFKIKAAPCFSVSVDLPDRRFAVTTYDFNGHTHTTSMALPYHSGAYTGCAFTLRTSPAPGGFDVSLVYELRPSPLKFVLEQMALRVYTDASTRQAAREAGGGVKGAAAALAASANQLACEIADLEVISDEQGTSERPDFQNLSTLLNKLPTAEANAPSTPDRFPALNKAIPKPDEPEVEEVEFPSPSSSAQQPPAPPPNQPLLYPPPSNPDPFPPPDEEPEEPEIPEEGTDGLPEPPQANTPPPEGDQAPEPPATEDSKPPEGTESPDHPGEDDEESKSQPDDDTSSPSQPKPPVAEPSGGEEESGPQAPEEEVERPSKPGEEGQESESQPDDDTTSPLQPRPPVAEPSGGEEEGGPQSPGQEVVTPSQPEDEEKEPESEPEHESTSPSQPKPPVAEPSGGEQEGGPQTPGQEVVTPSQPEDEEQETESAPEHEATSPSQPKPPVAEPSGGEQEGGPQTPEGVVTPSQPEDEEKETESEPDDDTTSPLQPRPPVAEPSGGEQEGGPQTPGQEVVTPSQPEDEEKETESEPDDDTSLPLQPKPPVAEPSGGEQEGGPQTPGQEVVTPSQPEDEEKETESEPEHETTPPSQLKPPVAEPSGAQATSGRALWK